MDVGLNRVWGEKLRAKKIKKLIEHGKLITRWHFRHAFGSQNPKFTNLTKFMFPKGPGSEGSCFTKDFFSYIYYLYILSWKISMSLSG